jgi:hypothetical protein
MSARTVSHSGYSLASTEVHLPLAAAFSPHQNASTVKRHRFAAVELIEARSRKWTISRAGRATREPFESILYHTSVCSPVRCSWLVQAYPDEETTNSVAPWYGQSARSYSTTIHPWSKHPGSM